MMNLHLRREAVYNTGTSDKVHYVLTSNKKVTHVLPMQFVFFVCFFISSYFVEAQVCISHDVMKAIYRTSFAYCFQ